MSEASNSDLLRDLLNRVYGSINSLKPEEIETVFEIFDEAVKHLETEFNLQFPKDSANDGIISTEEANQALKQACEELELRHSSQIQSLQDELNSRESKKSLEVVPMNEGNEDDIEKQFNEFYMIEHIIAERIKQLGKNSHDLFVQHKYDEQKGTIPLGDLQLALQEMGIDLTSLEMEFIQAKFPVIIDGEEDTQHIQFDKYLTAYLPSLITAKPINDKIRQSVLRLLMQRIQDSYDDSKVNSANTASENTISTYTADKHGIIMKPIASSASVSAPFATENNTASLLSATQRIDASLRLMRENMHARSVSLPVLFKRLKNERDVIPLDLLLRELPKQGFPTHKCTNDEIRAYCEVIFTQKRGISKNDPSEKTVGKYVNQNVDINLNYQDFYEFFCGKRIVDESNSEAKKSITSDPSFVQALVKLNSLPLHKHFNELDYDNHRMLTVDTIIDDLSVMGLNRTLLGTQELRDLIMSYQHRSKDGLVFDEYVDFITMRIGNLRQPRILLNVTIPEETTPPDCIHIIRKATMHGMNLNEILGEYVPYGSNRISEDDLWHAFQGIGINIPKNTCKRLFELFDPVEEIICADHTVTSDNQKDHLLLNNDLNKQCRTINYEELALTILKPQVHPRVGPNGVNMDKRSLHAISNVPLGTGISRLNDEFVQPKHTQAAQHRSELSQLRSKHSHKFDDDRMTEEEVAQAQIDQDPERRSLRNKSNTSTLDLALSELQKQHSDDQLTPLSADRQRALNTKFSSNIKFGSENVDHTLNTTSAANTNRNASHLFQPISEDDEEIRKTNQAALARLTARRNVIGDLSANVLQGEGSLSNVKADRHVGTKMLRVPNQSSFTISHEHDDEENFEVNKTITGSTKRRIQGLQTSDPSEDDIKAAGLPTYANNPSKSTNQFSSSLHIFGTNETNKDSDEKASNYTTNTFLHHDVENHTLSPSGKRPYSGAASALSYGEFDSTMESNNEKASHRKVNQGYKGGKASKEANLSSDSISAVFNHDLKITPNASPKNTVDDIEASNQTMKEDDVNEVQHDALHRLKQKHSIPKYQTISEVQESTAMVDQDETKEDNSKEEIFQRNIVQLSKLVYSDGKSRQVFQKWTSGTASMTFDSFLKGARNVGSTLPTEDLYDIFARFDTAHGKGS